MKKTLAHFRDSVAWNGQEKTAISVRDGVLEYYGAEIGYQPADKVFKVYRSPATIANAAALMRGIPVTNGHVDLDMSVATPAGEVLTARMIDLDKPEYAARLGVMNTLGIADELNSALDAGKRELSLGYRATLIESTNPDFDLEQVEIIPHHLAVVDAGRCGSVCSFIDRKGNDMTKKKDKGELHKAFKDAEGNPSMTEIVAIAQALPEALANLPVDELAKVLPVLQEIVSKAGSGAAAEAAASVDADPAAEGDEPKKETTTDEDPKKEVAVTDSKAFKDALAAGVTAAVGRHVKVMDKARQFLPEDYKFDGKSTEQVMRDTLAVEHGKQSFSDGELEIAFKMMKKTQSQHRSFGDVAATGKFSQLADKSL